MRYEMETSRPKGQWRSKMDQDEKGETKKMHLRMEMETSGPKGQWRSETD